MTKEGKVSSISKEEVSLSKCMAYSGRRDGLFNSHIWEYINLCVHTHIIYIPPSCGLDVNPQTKNIKKEKVDFESAKVFLLVTCVFISLYNYVFLCLFSSSFPLPPSPQNNPSLQAVHQSLALFVFVFVFFLLAPCTGLHWPPPSPRNNPSVQCTYNPSEFGSLDNLP